jgi:hypothetical protein
LLLQGLRDTRATEGLPDNQKSYHYATDT